MGKTQSGSITAGATFIRTGGAPLDDRVAVVFKTDLIDPNVWKVNSAGALTPTGVDTRYTGMIVFVLRGDYENIQDIDQECWVEDPENPGTYKSPWSKSNQPSYNDRSHIHFIHKTYVLTDASNPDVYSSWKEIGEGGGTQGYQGYQGVQGLTGEGTQGAIGAQGEIGTTGTQGFQGIQGLTGEMGTQGYQGIQGMIGTTGLTGTQGYQGEIGTQGYQGYQGYQGIQGMIGTTGLTGTQGYQGEIGTQGYQGYQGIQGITGEGTQGAIGTQGYQGYQGIQGMIGTTGLTGTQGYQGIAGEGIQGYQGIQGPAGGGGAGTDTKNTVGNEELDDQVLIMIGVQSVQGTSSDDWIKSYAHKEYPTSDEELERVAIALLPEGSSQHVIDAKVAELRADLAKGNTTAEGFNDKKQAIKDLNDNDSLNPYVNPHTMDGLMPNNNGTSWFTTLVSEYEDTEGKPLTPHIGTEGWLYIGKHRVIVDSDLNALWDIINNKFNPEIWPNPSYNPPSQPATPTIAATNNSVSLASKFRINNSTTITDGSHYNMMNFYNSSSQLFDLQITTPAAISVNTNSHLTYNGNESAVPSQITASHSIGNLLYGYKVNAQSERNTAQSITTSMTPFTPTVTRVAKDLTSDTTLKLEYLYRHTPTDNWGTENTITVNNSGGSSSISIPTASVVSENIKLKHGVNKFNITYHNPSTIKFDGGSGSIPAIGPVYVCSNRYNISEQHKASHAAVTISVANINTKTAQDTSHEITFYGVYPIYSNSLYNKADGSSTMGLRSSYGTTGQTGTINTVVIPALSAPTAGQAYGHFSGDFPTNYTVYNYDKSEVSANYITLSNNGTITMQAVFGNINFAGTGAKIWLPVISDLGYQLSVTSVKGFDNSQTFNFRDEFSLNIQQLPLETINGISYRPFEFKTSGEREQYGINVYQVVITKSRI